MRVAPEKQLDKNVLSYILNAHFYGTASAQAGMLLVTLCNYYKLVYLPSDSVAEHMLVLFVCRRKANGLAFVGFIVEVV